jgi:hypothetical protein
MVLSFRALENGASAADVLQRRKAIAFFLRQRTGNLGSNLRPQGSRTGHDARAKRGGKKTPAAEQRMCRTVIHGVRHQQNACRVSAEVWER